MKNNQMKNKNAATRTSPTTTNWITDQLYGLDSQEETTVDGMLGRGANRNAIVNAIRAQHSDVTS